MTSTLMAAVRRFARRSIRRAFGHLSRESRFVLYRRLINCDPRPSASLVLKIAETQEELEGCFAILHDAYVASGFMKPHASGLRVTIYHALPTTTTVCAKVHGEVVGTLSMVREGVFGLPLQSAFDLTPVRRRPGQVAEISALAVRADHQRTGGSILFPLMKFMYAYCTQFFDTRHLLIAVNPNKIELYESLLFFERLQAQVVDHYDFANGAPAVGASLDLQAARSRFEKVYAGRSERHDLYRYFTATAMPNLQLPQRRYFTTNDPVMTPALLDHFFNRRTQGFTGLDVRQRRLLQSIYDGPAYRDVLPPVDPGTVTADMLRHHQRHTIRCPGWFAADGGPSRLALTAIELSLYGCQIDLRSHSLAPGTRGELTVQLGDQELSVVKARVVRRVGGERSTIYGIALDSLDEPWRQCVHALEYGLTYRDLAK